MVDQKVLTDEQAREMMPYDPDDEDDNDTKDTNDDEDSVDENGVRSVLRLDRYHGTTLFLISTFLILRIPYDLLCLVIDSASWCWYSFSLLMAVASSMFIKLAKLSGFPSCGVADSIIRLSERSDKSWAKRLRCELEPRLATLCASSITMMSQ